MTPKTPARTAHPSARPVLRARLACASSRLARGARDLSQDATLVAERRSLPRPLRPLRCEPPRRSVLHQRLHRFPGEERERDAERCRGARLSDQLSTTSQQPADKRPADKRPADKRPADKRPAHKSPAHSNPADNPSRQPQQPNVSHIETPSGRLSYSPSPTPPRRRTALAAGLTMGGATTADLAPSLTGVRSLILFGGN